MTVRSGTQHSHTRHDTHGLGLSVIITVIIISTGEKKGRLGA